MSISIPSVIAHRGASKQAPENTLKAFRLAKEFGAEMVEIDVRLTKDGIPVISHDDDLERTAHQAEFVSQLTLSELQVLDVGEGEHIPTLMDTMRCLSELGLDVNIELKPTDADPEALVDAVLPKCQGVSNILISSFHLPILTLVRERSKDMALGALFTELPHNWSEIVEPLSCYSVHLRDRYVKEETVIFLKKNGYRVLVFTVDDEDRAKELFSWGVDGIFTNDPGKILPLSRRRVSEN